MQVQYIGKERFGRQIRYWFSLSGNDNKTGRKFHYDEYGITENINGCVNDVTKVYNRWGEVLTETNNETITVRENCIVTDDIRME